MAKNFAVSLLFSAVTLVMAGCALPESQPRYSLASTPSLAEPPDALHKSGDLASLIYTAAQTLADRAQGLIKTRPIIVATIVSVDDLDSSSTFGRLASQLIANRIEQRGFLVRDVTYMRALTLEPATGELALSRNASKIGAAINAQAVVAGTYAVAGREIYLNLRMLSADSGELISSADAVIPLNDNTYPLVGGTTLAQMPLDQYEAAETGR